MHLDIGFQNYLKEVEIILQNLTLSYQWAEIGYVKDDWKKIVMKITQGEMTEDDAKKVKSVIDRAK